jgi:hypothetical protein
VSGHNQLSVFKETTLEKTTTMSEQTSPTNLNEELESSAESATNSTNNPRQEPKSELPSAIRQNDESSSSQNLGNFNSPSVQPPDQMEASTMRLKRIRDKLANSKKIVFRIQLGLTGNLLAYTAYEELKKKFPYAMQYAS